MPSTFFPGEKVEVIRPMPGMAHMQGKVGTVDSEAIRIHILDSEGNVLGARLIVEFDVGDCGLAEDTVEAYRQGGINTFRVLMYAAELDLYVPDDAITKSNAEQSKAYEESGR